MVEPRRGPGNFFKLPGFNLYERKNYVLKLNNSYENLYAAYNDNIKRNLKKSEKLNLLINKNIAVAEVIKLSKEQASAFSSIDEDDFLNFEKLYQTLYQKEKATTYGVFTKEGQLLAAAVFFFSFHITGPIIFWWAIIPMVKPWALHIPSLMHL